MTKIVFPTLETARTVGIAWGAKNREIYAASNDYRHTGLDLYDATKDTSIYAVAYGVVKWAGYETAHGYGRHVLIHHNIDGVEFYSRYAHLADMGVKDGDIPLTGEVIGIMGGETSDPYRGASSGKHLHFEILLPEKPTDRDSFLIGWNGLYTVDPLRWLADTFLHFELGRGVAKSYNGVNVRREPSVSSAKVEAYPFGYEFAFVDERYDDAGNLWVRVRDLRELWLCVKYGRSTLVDVEYTAEKPPVTEQELPIDVTNDFTSIKIEENTQRILALEEQIKRLMQIAGLS
jgi:hypothetical protein